MNSEYLFDKEGSDIEIERFEGLLLEFRIEPLPPALSRASAESRRSFLGRYKLAFALSFSSLLVVFLAACVLFSRFSRRESPGRVELDKPTIAQESQNNLPVIHPLPVAAIDPTKIIGRTATIRPSPRRMRRTPTPTVVERAKDGTRLTPEELYAYQKLKVALFLAGSKMKIVQDTINQVDDVEQKGKLKR